MIVIPRRSKTPVAIEPDDWPIVARAEESLLEDHTTPCETTANCRKYSLSVRQHGDVIRSNRRTGSHRNKARHALHW